MTGWQPGFDLDRRWGEDGEDIVRKLSNHTVEVKRKSRIDDLLYVELQQDPHRRGQWKPSGLNITTADYWAYVIGDTDFVIFIPTDSLRWAVEQGYGKEAAERDGDNPTKGRLLRLSFLIQSSGEGLSF